MTEENAEPWQLESFRRLVLRAKRTERSWPDLDREFKALGKKTTVASIRDYLNRKRVTGELVTPRHKFEEVVRRTAEAFCQSTDSAAIRAFEDSWLRSCGFLEEESPLRDRREILAMQRALPPGAEVWVISCRSFLEGGDDKEVRDLVLDNLKRGVVYKYFFPNIGDDPDGSGPFQRDAEKSYEHFRFVTLERAMKQSDPGRPPQIYGFRVDPRKFQYFSELNTLVHYRPPGEDGQMLCFIEHAAPGVEAQAVPAWYSLPNAQARKVEARLGDAREPIADHMRPRFGPESVRLANLSRAYRGFFAKPEGSELYARVRRLANHTTTCAERIAEYAFNHPDNTLRVLDIGCGDGETLKSLLSLLQDSYKIELTVVEPSPVDMKQAANALDPFSPKMHELRFEDAPLEPQSYDLVVGIHSFYTIDPSYLRRAFELLAPGGRCCLWIGALGRNAMNQICDAVDRSLRIGQQRNYGEVLESALSHMLDPALVNRTEHESQIGPLVDAGNLNGDGMDIASFFALQALNRKNKRHAQALNAAYEAAEQTAQYSDGKVIGHSVLDYLLMFQSPSIT